MRTIFILLILFTATISIPVSVAAKGKAISKIVLDAGHGGKDFGAQGAVSKEKDITLAITLKLGKILADSMKQVQVIYTRTTDCYPSLEDRHEIANKANADLFVCVHVNSTAYTYTKTLAGYKTVTRHHKKTRVPIYNKVRHHTTNASGVESYVMGLHRAGQQNEAIGEYSDNVTNEPGLLNPNDPQTSIIVAQYSQAFLNKSVTLGSMIQEQFSLEGRPDLGVKQKGLEVLAGSAMPGVLVEVGFITNITEEAYLNSEKGQHEVAMAIYRGIKAYKDEAEK